jgi:hypothetical protein
MVRITLTIPFVELCSGTALNPEMPVPTRTIWQARPYSAQQQYTGFTRKSQNGQFLWRE